MFPPVLAFTDGTTDNVSEQNGITQWQRWRFRLLLWQRTLTFVFSTLGRLEAEVLDGHSNAP
jgi:hypothetical protein